MWLPNDVIASVDHVATIRYINMAECRLWNDNRHDGELRLLTGWIWVSKDGQSHRQGFKTITIAYRDAWYSLVKKTSSPVISQPVVMKVKRRVKL
jgi:hypothetical protein